VSFFCSLTNQIKEVQSENVDLSAVITILIQLKQKVLFILLDLEVYAFMMVALFIYFEVNFAMKNLSNWASPQIKDGIDRMFQFWANDYS